MDTLILAHGAGSNRDAPLLVAVDAALSSRGLEVVRIDLPFRQRRRSGPPRPGDAVEDRAALREHAAAARRSGQGRVFLGGHSYGGRQASMLASEQPGAADALLLLSYPLHPPRRPDQLRTQHFPALRVPCLFVHGSRDPFATVDELKAATEAIPGRVELLEIEGAGHDLQTKKRESRDTAAALVAGRFLDFVR